MNAPSNQNMGRSSLQNISELAPKNIPPPPQSMPNNASQNFSNFNNPNNSGNMGDSSYHYSDFQSSQ